MIRDVHNQAEMDAAIADGDTPNLLGDDSVTYVIREGSPRVEASGSSSPRVVAYDSSSPRVVASGSSSPRVVASGSSSPRVEAYGSSSPRVEAYDSSSPRVVASPDTPVVTTGAVHVTGGRVSTFGPAPTTAEAWCARYGVPVRDGVAILYKAVRDDYTSTRSLPGFYTPGATPEAPDWDGGNAECGGGLHFCPRPLLALRFDVQATRYLACPVAVADMRAPQETDDYPHKIKAARCCAPIYEVDDDGEPVVKGGM